MSGSTRQIQAASLLDTAELMAASIDVAAAHLHAWRKVVELKREHLARWETFSKEHPAVPIDRTLTTLRESIAELQAKIAAAERRLVPPEPRRGEPV